MRLHTEIKKVEARVRSDDPKLRLHAYVLSVTPRDRIGEKLSSREQWERQGVYFLEDESWARRLLGHFLASPKR